MTVDYADDWRTALDECAAQLLDEAGIVEPPIDALQLAAVLGFVVAVDDRQACRARHVQLPGYEGESSPAILLRPEPRVERRQWAVAHEIGEHYAYEVCARLGVDPQDLARGDRERTANALANRLLLPSPWFLRDGRAYRWDLGALKRRYVTASYELIARRMLEADAPAVVTIVDHGQISFRRNNFGGRAAGLSAGERETWHRAHTTGMIHRRNDLQYRVGVWPIHEPEWKREIMRTEPVAADEFA
jgi:hypothetical protein